MHDIRIAIAICSASVGKTRDNLDKTIDYVKQARERGAGIICFPEMNLTGYSNHLDITDLAEPIPGPSVDKLLVLSAKEDIIILAGLAEKDHDGRIYASHAVIAPDGLSGVYRKLYIAPPEQTIYTAGNHIPVFKKADITFGVQLCYDVHFPELSTKMAALGAEVIFAPHASPRGKASDKHQSWMRHMPARAYDNSVFIVACNQTGDNLKGLHFPGNGMIIGPSGHILEKWVTGDEALHFFDLKTDELERVRSNRMHFFLPNRRPELYP